MSCDSADGLALLDAVRLELLFVLLATLLRLGSCLSYCERAGRAIGTLDEGEDVVAWDTCLEVEEIRWVDGDTHEACFEVEVGPSRAARATAETDGVTSADDRPFADEIGRAHV